MARGFKSVLDTTYKRNTAICFAYPLQAERYSNRLKYQYEKESERILKEMRKKK